MRECGTETTVYRFGGLSRGIGKEATDNPFTPLTKAWFDWADGWKNADEFFVGRNLDL